MIPEQAQALIDACQQFQDVTWICVAGIIGLAITRIAWWAITRR